MDGCCKDILRTFGVSLVPCILSTLFVTRNAFLSLLFNGVLLVNSTVVAAV